MLKEERMMMMKRKTMLILALLTAIVHVTHGQSNVGQDPESINALNTIYYFDSNSDCNGPKKQLNGFQGTIRGNDITSTRLGPQSCIIKVQSASQFDGTILDIELKAMNILDCSTVVSIYDGDGTNLILMSFDCHSYLNMYKRRFQTTGDTATFQMKRENLNSFNFDIEIKIDPIRGGTNPGYENNFGSGYFFDKFPQSTIVGMIGGFYGLILAICIIIIIQFGCKYMKLNKKWEIQQLATIKKVDTLQTQRLVGVEKEKPKSQYVSSNASFSEPEDDSDHFVEKVITPRVKTNKRWQPKRPPSYSEAVSDHASNASSDEESQVSGSESTIRKRPLSSDESRSEKSGSSYTQSETGSEAASSRSSNNSSRAEAARAQREKRKLHKSKIPNSDSHDGRIHRPHREHQQATQPQSMPAAQYHMQQVPYGVYPSGQFVPVMVGPNQFQQVAIPPNFPPPSYSDEQAAAQGSQVHLTDPPVYSYLVQRGYKPLDARSGAATSVAGSHRAGRGRSEDPELRLDSGVEYMRR
ncbi:hypothetical protein BsWGS_13852 [Bradybaena similaris]